MKTLPCGAMRARAGILILIWTILLVEPVSANFSIKSIYSSNCETQRSCSSQKEEPKCCKKSACDQNNENEDGSDCERNRCNPLMSCPSGNFYLFNQQNLSIAPLKLTKQKKALINDNRVVKQNADCWHPPEII